MKRIHLFEFEDLPWFPALIRQWMTLYLAAFHRALGTAKMVAPLLARVLRTAGSTDLVDLCSGAGGPLLDAHAQLEQLVGAPVSIRFTDLYPNKMAAAGVAARRNRGLYYHPEPVDASDVPKEWTGVRCMICAFHHMPPAVARRIITDACEKRRPIVIFEISDNAPPNWLLLLTMPLSMIVPFLVMPLVRPLTALQLFFTYVIPILPLFVAWDGTISNVRTYTQADLRELLAGLNTPGYHWEMGYLTKPWYPSRMPYLIGTPTADS
jgi:hypothetical protein